LDCVVIFWGIICCNPLQLAGKNVLTEPIWTQPGKDHSLALFLIDQHNRTNLTLD
jgi:hypothetical protein